MLGRRRLSSALSVLAISRGCVLHGTDSGVCDLKFDAGYNDADEIGTDGTLGWSKGDTKLYRAYHMPTCHRYVDYAACVPEQELVDQNATNWDDRYKPKQRIEPDLEFPNGRFMEHTIRNKDLWAHNSTWHTISSRKAYEQSSSIEGRSLYKEHRNEYGEGECEEDKHGDDATRCKKWSACGGVGSTGCNGYPIEIRFWSNKDCQNAFEAYFCYINFPRCTLYPEAQEYKTVPICKSACKNFFKACNYDKSLWRCGRSEYFNGLEPENYESYGTYLRDFFPGQPFKNSFKERGYQNIDGRCTPGTPDVAAPRPGPALAALALTLALAWGSCR